ncbi:hypothetical protein BGX24_007163 [Mortierella sp. AD032]|nr:hypothetical protein BGX24_007163 [Mortierella sp. AD032]
MYSLWCNLYTLPRIARAVIMSTLAIILLVAEFMFLVDKIKGSNKTTHSLPLKDGAGPSKSSPFLCDTNADVACYLENSNQFISIVTGLFVLAEVVVTMVVKEKKKEVMYILEDRDDDDSDGGSVIIMY